MSHRFGLIVPSQQKLTKVSNLNLLIVTDEGAELNAIVEALEIANLDFSYCSTSASEIYLYLSNLNYDAIIYSYGLLHPYKTPDSPLMQIDWWQKIKKLVPLILITDILGDEIAVECIQAGISGYVLRHKLYKLPIILEQSITNFTKQQAQAEQLAKIRQQQAYIEQLEQEKQRLETAEASTQEFISHLNHELRSPIAATIGFARMLKEEIYGSLNEKQMQYIKAITTTGEHALDLINDYLDLAKINADKEELELENLAVEDICRASLAIVEERARQKELKLNLNIDREVDFCRADKLRLKQILVNLLSNAVKFTQQGSVTLQVTSQGDNLQFAVIDTGIGISPENQKKLFQPFIQLPNSNSSEKGTGLGLALSRKLAILHGGDIILTSTEGKGSCFTLHIPRVAKNSL